jgi:hypothetical protein
MIDRVAVLSLAGSALSGIWNHADAAALPVARPNNRQLADL